MATTKKQLYIEAELQWAETKLEEWKEYVDNNPIARLRDRIEWKPTSKGGQMPMVIASIEQQIKSIRDTMKEYLVLLDQVNKMRQTEEAKKVLKGGIERPTRMS